VLEVLEGLEGGGVFGEVAGEGVESFFDGGALLLADFVGLDREGAFGAVLLAGAEEEGGVAGKRGGLGLAAGDLAKSFLAQGGEDGVRNLRRAWAARSMRRFQRSWA
jgi:hypothetical protein